MTRIGLTWPKRSLRYKFIVTLALFTIVLSVSFGWISAQRLKAEMERQVLDRGYRHVEGISRQLLAPENDNIQDLKLTIGIYSLLVNQPVGEEVLFIEAVKGEDVETYTRKPQYEEILASTPMPKIDRTERVAKRRAPASGIPYYDLVVALPPPKDGEGVGWEPGHPAPLEEEPIAYLHLGISLQYVEEVVRQELLKISGLSMLYILIGLAVAFWLYKSILGPVDVLTQSVKRFKQDRQTRAQVTSGDELQTLGDEFNRMADTIQERDERLERINRELRKANQVKSEFLAAMGHELKTPLHAIRGYAQLLLEEVDGSLTSGQREDLGNIVKSEEHLRALIDNVLQFSKVESGEETIHPSRVEVAKLMREALQNVQVFARGQNTNIHTEANGLSVEADETKLKQVLINLLSNAVKYAPEGHVEMTAERENGEVVFSVRDTGVGIPEAYREQIFEPFTQIDSSTTRRWSGIGLGLSIVKTYVDMHGGRIEVESEEGKGSTFRFTIPDRRSQGLASPTRPPQVGFDHAGEESVQGRQPRERG